MSGPTLLQIMQGIETRLKTIEGLRTSYYIADQINPPQAIVGCPPIDSYRQAMGKATYQINAEVYIFVGGALDRTGQESLASYASPTGTNSIPAAIEGDRTLGGLVQDCVADSFRPLGMEEVGLIGYYGGVFTVRVYASGIA